MTRSPRKLPTRALFWDIDGTLLVTGRAGMIAWERAFAAETGGSVFPSVRPDGLTDHQIAAWLLGDTALDRTPPANEQARAARLVARYEHELVPALPLRQGRVLDNVTAVLGWVRTYRPGLLSWLVTGNTRAGGTAKLRHYGLNGFFEALTAPDPPGAEAPLSALLPGAFSSQVEPRARIARSALEMAQARLPGLEPGEVLVIGDTPHDIEGAHAIGVPVLALATNTHSLDELASHRPWKVLTALPIPEAFDRLLPAG
ncbi:MAG: HAD family hydrolase [Acidobacteria bacterium]|nr:HAD family hydrolase [Acidobacteriota bacterium]